MATVGHTPAADLLPSRVVMAKADLTPGEHAARLLIGTAIARCFALAGLSQKEAAGLLDRDAHQIARWVSGAERPQVDRLFGVGVLRTALVIALAEIAGEGIEIETVVRVRRQRTA